MYSNWYEKIIRKVNTFKKTVSEFENTVFSEKKRFKDVFERNLVLEDEISVRTEELSQANKSLLTLKHIWGTMNSSEPLSELLTTVINGLSDELGYLYCFVFQLYDFKSGSRLKIRAANESDFSSKIHDVLQNSIFSYDIPFSAADNVIVQSINDQKIKTVNSFKSLFQGSTPAVEDERLLAVDKLIGKRAISILPIIVQGKPFGCFVAISSRKEIGATENNFLSLFAGQIELAVTIANLFEQVKKQAITDGLTDLFNRRHFDQCLTSEAERAVRLKQPFSLVTLDLDHLKVINDKFGHAIGDEAIKQIGQVLKNNARSVDIPARFGGEEFAVILPGIDKEGGLIAAERLRVAIETCYVKEAETITASIGVATFLRQTDSLGELLEIADQAMYRAKKNGRNRVEVATKQEDQDWRPILMNTFIEMLMRHNIPSVSKIIKEVNNTIQDDSLFDMMYSMLNALSQMYSSVYKKEYIDEKLQLFEAVALELGLDVEEIDKLKIACLLHDISNLLMPETIIFKPGPLTKEERQHVLEQPIFDVKEMLRPLKSTGYIIKVVEHHHEHWDGTGFPGLLSGENIPRGARLLFIIDAYYAMINQRPYREALSSDNALEILKNGAGTVWDEHFVSVFAKVIKENINSEVSNVI